MGVAGWMFEPHPPNFENLYNFWYVQMMLKWLFDYLYWFQIFKDQCGSIPSIPVGVLKLRCIPVGYDIGLGVSFKSICFDFFSTYVGSSVIWTRTCNSFDIITL